LPLYEYECRKDGRFEVIQKFSDRPLKKCPTCGGPVEKVLSAPAIQFKGSGWYVTDYARKSNGDGDKKGDKSGEAKPDAGSGKDASADAGSKTSKPEKTADKKPASSGSRPN
jgi:putative FmdB family regulatory protein